MTKSRKESRSGAHPARKRSFSKVIGGRAHATRQPDHNFQVAPVGKEIRRYCRPQSETEFAQPCFDKPRRHSCPRRSSSFSESCSSQRRVSISASSALGATK